jgi:proteasome beta subunit
MAYYSKEAEQKIAEIKKTGTTTVGVMCGKAVVLGAERKATMGSMVANKNARKILQLDEKMAMTIAGVVGDAQALERYIKAEVKLFKLNEGRNITVKGAANLITNMLYWRRFYPYFVQLVVGGFDTEPHLYSFDPSGSMMEEKEYFSTGSGSPFALGVLEDNYKPNIEVDAAKRIVVRAIRAAMERDAFSGGTGIDLVVIDSGGFHAVPDEEVKKLMK